MNEPSASVQVKIAPPAPAVMSPEQQASMLIRCDKQARMFLNVLQRDRYRPHDVAVICVRLLKAIKRVIPAEDWKKLVAAVVKDLES